MNHESSVRKLLSSVNYEVHNLEPISPVSRVRILSNFLVRKNPFVGHEASRCRSGLGLFYVLEKPHTRSIACIGDMKRSSHNADRCRLFIVHVYAELLACWPDGSS